MYEDLKNTDETIAIYELSGVIEAEVLENILAANGIPCIIRRFHDEALGGIFTGELGWGRIRVMKRDEIAARQIILEYLKSKDQPDYEF